MESLLQLIYLSRAADNLSHTDIEQILFKSRNLNEKNKITGLLIHKDGFFLQVLEGGEIAVLETLSRIVQDRRHHHLQVLVECKTNARTFECWPMAFLDGDLQSVCDQATEQIDRIFKLALGPVNQEKESLVQYFKCFKKHWSVKC